MSQSVSSNSIISHYRIISKLGEGGMGEVWLAEDTRLGRKVALKILPAELTEDSERVRRFIQEAKAASALNHPNIISVFDIGECESGRFIVMEFVSGKTLRHVIAEENSAERLFTLGTQIAKALSAAHAAGITHRDIKPDNIMVRDDGYVKMLDFGLARLLPTASSEGATIAQQTAPGTVMGTLAYMSPEQASGEFASAPSDVFALGVVLYELATGQHPFRSETMVGYLHAITSQAPASLTSVRPDLNLALDELILRMLEKEAVNRPAASEVAQALTDIERYGTTTAVPPRTLIKKFDDFKTTRDEGFWLAVLPFKYRGTDPALQALVEGLSEDIITGLSRFSNLHVIARGSTLRFTSETADVRSIGTELSARYVMDGSLRQAGSMLRLVVQLVDASTGAHLWAETYDRQLRAEEIFALQDELVPQIVSTVADWYGVLTHSMSEVVRLKPIDQLTPYEALLRSYGYYERVTAEEQKAARSALERAVKQAPGSADLWAMLSLIYGEEYRFDFNVLPDPLGRSLQAAKRAVSIAPSNHFAYLALAQALFFSKEFEAFRIAADRSIALNPMDGSTLEYLAHLICFSGDWEYGGELAERSRLLNPNHPPWYWAVPLLNSYRKGDYAAARGFLFKGEMTNDLWRALCGAVYGQLDERELAEKTVRELLVLRPDFAQTGRKTFEKWYQPDLVEALVEGLSKAGLDLGKEVSTTSSPLGTVSGQTRTEEGFWIAVLPFNTIGTNTDLQALASGLTEDIVTGLSRFSYLRVIARGSTLRYAHEATDLRAVGKELGARYVIEGNLRQAGLKMRLAVQLIDTTNGVQLWAETYERTFNSGSIFDLQDELVPPIVSTVADLHGVLPRSMGEAVHGKTLEQLTPYESLLRSFRFTERVTPELLRDALTALELAVQKTPAYGDVWAMLASLYTQDYGQGFNLVSDPLSKAEAAARKAIELAPANHLAWFGLAGVHFFQKELQSLRNAAERAVALNPMDGNSLAHLGELLTFAGDFERGLELAGRAKHLNPHHPGWYWYADFYQAYEQHDYRAALAFARRVNLPGHWAEPMLIAAASGQLGEHESADKAVRDLLMLRPDISLTVRRDMEKWWSAAAVEHLLEGLRKAGITIPDDKTR